MNITFKNRMKLAGAIIRKGIDGIPFFNSSSFSISDSSSKDFKRTEKGDKQAYINNFTSWVYSAVSCIARHTAKVDIKLYKQTSEKKGKESWEEIFEHPFLDLLKNPNPWMDMYYIKYLTEVYLGILGNAYWYLPKNKLGQPGQIIPLLAQKVIPYTKNQIEIDHYEYLVGTNIVNFSPDEVLHFKEPNPNSLIMGLSPLDALLLSVDTNRAMMEYSMSLFEQGAFFGTIVKVPKDISEQDYIRLKQEIKEQFTGVGKAGRTKIIHGDIQVDSLVKTMAELDFEAGRRLTKKDILEGYGVPEFKLGEGASTASTSRATAYELDRVFIEETIQPRLIRRDSVLNKFLLPVWDDKLVCESENISATDKEFLLQQETARIQTGYWSINEVRALNGEPPAPWGYRPWVGLNMVQMAGFVSEEAKKENQGIHKKKRQMRENWQQVKEQKWKSWVRKEENTEKKYIADLKKFFSEQEKIVLSNLRRIFDTGKSKEIKELVDFVFPNLDQQAEKLSQISKGHIREAIVNGVMTAVEFQEENNKNIKEEPSPDDLARVGFTPASFDAYVNQIIKVWKDLYGFTINQTIQDELRELLNQAITGGWSISQTQSEIELLYSGYTSGISPEKSLRIARTEISRIMNDSEHMCYKNLGYKEKTWASEEADEALCEDCEAMDEEVVGIDELFSCGVLAPPLHPNSYDSKTEIYTKEGWKNVKDLKIGDWCLSLNPDTFDLKYSKVIKTYKHKPDKMIHFYNRNIDLLVTEDHNMFYQPDIFEKWKFVKAKELLNHSTGRMYKGFELFVEDGKKTKKKYFDYIYIKNIKKEIVKYSDYAYCVDIEKFHTLLTRRNGKVLWSGNCRCNILAGDWSEE